ncbi:MAG: hypothetical protein BWY63_03772 [Chloroflexi bacterium ADurb.Bin360]|nr:MAG: hypothetical protein BWY63_03772 [Chloroflexi bacterium ADurb.Bin360]
MDRSFRQTILGVPHARTPVQVSDPLGLRLHQSLLQHLGKEMVVTVPAALIIKRYDKQIAALQGLQHSSTVLVSGDGSAQRSTQPIKNSRLQQEAARAF